MSASDARAPARFSVHKDDPGHALWQEFGGHSRAWRIYLDGERVMDVVTADIDSGYVEVNRRVRGELVLDREKHRAETEILTGDVAVECVNRETGELVCRWQRAA